MGRAQNFIQGQGKNQFQRVYLNEQGKTKTKLLRVKLFSKWLAAFLFLLCKYTKNIIISTDWVIDKVWKKIAQLYKVRKKNVIIFFHFI